MKKIRIAILMLTALLALSIPASAHADTSDFANHLYFKDETYNVYYDKDDYAADDCDKWNYYNKSQSNETVLEFDSTLFCCDDIVKVPDSITTPEKNTRYISSIRYSCAIKEFDLNPENKYMALIDNVIFSKDGKTLMSYARFDEREVYKIPDNTEVISKYALNGCDNIFRIEMPDSVIKLENGAFSQMDSLEKINISPSVEELSDTFWNCYNLKEVIIPKNSKLKVIDGGVFYHTSIKELIFPDFNIEISDLAFGDDKKYADRVNLKSYVQPDVSAEKADGNAYRLKWDKISNASYYEVYQKKSDGSYKLLKTVNGNSIKINKLKNGKSYTFAVKAFADIEAKPYDQQDYIVSYQNLPEYYTIEGTMSEDVTIDLK